jgi:hypothetical protein
MPLFLNTPSSNNMCGVVNPLLSSPKLQKLVVFAPFRAESGMIRQLKRVDEQFELSAENIDASLQRIFILPLTEFSRYFDQAEQLSSIVDDRFILAHYAELFILHNLSNEAFWDSVERV